MKVATKNKIQKGYTLVELAISTSILAMLAVGGLSIMGKKNEADSLQETHDKLAKIETAIKGYIRKNNFVPCPAPPALPSSSEFFGYKVAYNVTSKKCDNDATGNGVGDSDINASGNNSGDILSNSTGAVPVRTLGLPDDYAYDGWDRKFTYRIADGAGSISDFDTDTFHGDIAIMDRKGIHKTNINNLPPYNNGAIYVIISYGSNGKNVAWGKNVTTPPSQATGVERNNTNHANKSYVQAPKTETFDDIVAYGMKKDFIPPYNISSPIGVDPLTCQNAAQLLNDGRSSLNALGASTSDSLADQIYKNAITIDKLCKSTPAEKKLPIAFRGLVLWLDADDNNTVFSNSTCTTLAVAGTNNVGCWQDKSDNKNNAIQTIGGFQPSYSSNALNSKNALTTSGDHMVISDSSSLDSVQNSTFFYVAEANTFKHNVLLHKASNNNSVYGHFQFSLSKLLGQSFFSTAGFGHAYSPFPINKPTIFGWSVTLSNPVEFYENGEKINESSISVASALTPNNENAYLFSHNPGPTFEFSGKTGEVILYNTTLSDKERDAIELYLSDKWSIELNQDTDNEICQPGMKFIVDHRHPEGACQCVSDTKELVQELNKNIVACFYGQKQAFNKCQLSGSNSSPQYANPPTNSGQALWLDANDCTTITLSGTAGSVTKWADKSPNGFDATNSVLNQMPTYTQNAINGISTVNFDGTNDNLTLGNNYIYSANDGLEIFSVARSDVNTPDKYILDFGNNVTKGYGFGYSNNVISQYISTGNGGVSLSTPYIRKTATDASILNMEVKFGTSGDLKFFMDGNQILKNSVTITRLTALEINESSIRLAASGPVTIGSQSKTTSHSTKFFNGHIGEVIVYDKKMTDYESSNIENYLADKWNINNDPYDFNSLEIWLDANDTNTLYTTDDCSTTKANVNLPVACWKDKSKNTNNAVQVYSSSFRPILRSTTLNNKPALAFDGLDDFMIINNHASINLANNFDYFVAFDTLSVNTAPKHRALIEKMFDLSNIQLFSYLHYNNDRQAGYYNSNTSLGLAGGPNIINAIPHINNISVGPPSAGEVIVSLYANGSPAFQRQIDNYTGPNNANVRIGRSHWNGVPSPNVLPFQGRIGEILFFSKQLSVSEREYIEQYLASKWGVTINQ